MTPQERPARAMGRILGAILTASLFGAVRWRPAPTGMARPVDPHPGCLAACHSPHRGTGRPTVLPTPSLEGICLGCHGGKPQPALDLGAVKLPPWIAGTVSRHGGAPAGSPASAYRRVVRQGGRTVVLRDDCSACHDVHGKGPGMPAGAAFDARGQLLGVRPANAAQLCFGCHAGPEAARLGRKDPDVGALFARNAMSSHAIGRSAADRPDLPSLRGSEFRGRLDCTSCHDNPDPSGPRGPHVSSFPSLLKASYGGEQDAGTVGDQANELCFQCHDRRSIEADRSFPLHREHLAGFTGTPSAGGFRRPFALGVGASVPLGMRIGGQAGAAGASFPGYGEPTPCATCHDPHGSSSNPSLIRFDPTVVSRSSVGGVDFYRSGLGHGTCTLTCHGYDHVQSRY